MRTTLCTANLSSWGLLQSLKRKATAATGDSTAEMDEALEKALVQVADDFITGAVAFASGLAKRRKSNKLEAADVAVYLERNWYKACLPPA